MPARFGGRARQVRLNQNRIRAKVAAKSGAVLKLARRLELRKRRAAGSVRRILHARGLVDPLDDFLPHLGVGPPDLGRLAGRTRRQASDARCCREGAANGN